MILVGFDMNLINEYYRSNSMNSSFESETLESTETFVDEINSSHCTTTISYNDSVDRMDIVENSEQNLPNVPEDEKAVLKFLFDQCAVKDFSEIGAGAFSKVYKASIILPYSEGKKSIPVAVKILNNKALRNSKMASFQKDRFPGDALPVLIPKDRNIVQTYAVITKRMDGAYLIHTKEDLRGFSDEKLCAVVMEYIDGAKELKKDLYNSQDVKKITKDLLSGLSKIHEYNVIHRDIKCNNLIICRNNNIKIIDFGLSKKLNRFNLKNTHCGTPLYVPPELMKGESLTTKSDIWSVGVLAYELLTGSEPLKLTPGKYSETKDIYINLRDYQDNFSTFEKFQNLKINSPNISNDWMEFFNSCLAPMQTNRLSANELLKLKIFNQLD